MPLRYRRIALSICTSSSKTDPARCILSPSKSQKSHGATSGLYGGCSNSGIQTIRDKTICDETIRDGQFVTRHFVTRHFVTRQFVTRQFVTRQFVTRQFETDFLTKFLDIRLQVRNNNILIELL